MVAGSLVFARGFVNMAGARQGFEGVADQNMVNAQAPVAPKRRVAVIPPAVTLGRLCKQSVAVMQAQGDQGAQVVALLFGAVNLLAHAFWVPHIVVVKSDVVVAHQHQLRVLL